MPNDLEQRQLEYEVRALEHGREDARRKVAGARTPADVEICGGGQNADSAHRRQGLLYKIATVEIPNLIAEIIKKRDEHGTKSAFIFTALAQCGSDADIAFAVVKTFFNTLFCGYDKDDDENGDPEDVSVATMATKVADTVFNLRIRNKKQAKRKKRGKRFALEKKTIKQLSQDEQLRIGMALVQLYLKSTKYYKICPMLAAKNGGFRGPDAVQATDSAFDEILAEFSHSLHAGVASDIERLVRDLISPTWSPMLVPPNPWVAMRNGGYIVELAGKMSLVKGRSKMSGFSMKECPEVFEAINHLQATKFRINTFVFDIYNSLFSDLLEKIKSPISNDSICCQRELNYLDKILNLPRKDMERNFSNNGVLLSRNLHQSLVHLFMIRQEAEAFLKDEFYFVHFCDFRGRIYPATGHLNYQAGDLSRSLIEFAEGKPICDANAEKWLAIHGANCYAEKKNEVGLDKAPFSSRLEWVQKNEKSIIALGTHRGSFLDIASDLKEWWLKADKPWAFLAWANEWAKYKADPGKYCSHLPVDVDGSSNGYQHIAALLQSKNLAKQVNMLPVDPPYDIYTHITKKAREDIERQDAGNILELLKEYNGLSKMKETRNESQLLTFKKKIMALSLENDLPRSVAKKIVMTYPYSATLYKMAKILERERSLFRRWNVADFGAASADQTLDMKTANDCIQTITNILPQSLAEIMRENIRQHFPEVALLLEWFKKTGKIASSKHRAIQWTSPSGFVVRQEYEEKKSFHISVFEKRFTCKMGTGKPNTEQHGSGLGPNFIHSCDAAHMMRTINAAAKAGIGSFRMIHDSYATHAADMGKLNRILRDEFVKMYRENDWLQELWKSLKEQTGGGLQGEALPLIGDFDLESVKDAKYFFA